MRCFRLLPLLITVLLSACGTVVLHPAGDVAAQQRDVLLVSTGLMLLIIVPVMALIVIFAWKYRATNLDAEYEPDWHHSTKLELVIWSAPLLIIICLGAVTWLGTHLLDPYRPLDRISRGQAVSGAAPLVVDVVALDWKWLFLYPEQGIATVNQLDVPVGRPLDFRITSASVMNSFYAPAMAGQVYAMAGMETRLHAVMNRAGDYSGFSANFSGPGFSDMHFALQAQTAADFAAWAGRVKAGGGMLDRAAYLALAQPSEHVAAAQFGGFESGLFAVILNQCATPGSMCMGQMAAVDAQGGLGLLPARTVGGRDAAICTTSEAREARAGVPDGLAADTARLRGADLPLPPFAPFLVPATADVAAAARPPAS